MWKLLVAWNAVDARVLFPFRTMKVPHVKVKRPGRIEGLGGGKVDTAKLCSSTSRRWERFPTSIVFCSLPIVFACSLEEECLAHGLKRWKIRVSLATKERS